MPLISFGETLNDISLENLETLLSLSADRVCVTLDQVSLEQIFDLSPYSKLRVIEEPNLHECRVERAYFVRLLKKQNYHLIDLLLSQNKNLMKVTMSDNEEE